MRLLKPCLKLLLIDLLGELTIVVEMLYIGYDWVGWLNCCCWSGCLVYFLTQNESYSAPLLYFWSQISNQLANTPINHSWWIMGPKNPS